MNNQIIFLFSSVLLTIVNRGKTCTKKQSLNLKKSRFKSQLDLLIGILISSVIILILILLYIFYIHSPINKKNEKTKRETTHFNIPIVSYNINELDTIQTVGTPSELADHSEIKTII